MKKSLIVPVVLFSLVMMLFLNHMLRGLNFMPIALLLLPAFGLIVAASKENN